MKNKVRPLHLPEDTRWNVFEATMKHLEDNLKLQLQLDNEFKALQLRRQIGHAVYQMLDEVTVLTQNHTKQFGLYPQHA